MPIVTARVQCPIVDSFRVRQIAGMKDDKNGVYVVEYFASTSAEPKVVLPRVRSGYQDGMTLVPLYRSPDGQRVAVKYRTEKDDAPRLAIIDREGKIIRDVEL